MVDVHEIVPPIIELEGVGLRRDGKDILRDVHWRIDAARHWAVLGPNGSGKTTLLLVACGYVWPTSGIVRRCGEELIDLRALRRSIGWVVADVAAQIPAEELAIETVVSGKFAQIGLRSLGEQQAEPSDYTSARQLLEAMQCDGLAGKPFRVLSHGERQQVLIARARMPDPLIIFLDEPCSGMDPGARERFLAWLDGVAASQASPAMVHVTHHVEEILPSFESTLVLKAGQVAACGTTSEVITAPFLSDLYGVRVERLERNAGRFWPIFAGA